MAGWALPALPACQPPGWALPRVGARSRGGRCPRGGTMPSPPDPSGTCVCRGSRRGLRPGRGTLHQRPVLPAQLQVQLHMRGWRGGLHTPVPARAPPRASGAIVPRRVSIPGRCCQQWVCDHDARRPRKTTQRHTSALGGCEELEVRAQEGVAIGGGRGGRGEGGALTLYDWHASAMTPSPQTSAH